ncbi:Uncharacterized protein HZ326_5693 [Fusarium oxysporum f. sp. albedinis]|nr:Uncharacterized protein HZ326_5693 [Fusarium oxysporum f. sp. albedinis]
MTSRGLIAARSLMPLTSTIESILRLGPGETTAMVQGGRARSANNPVMFIPGNCRHRSFPGGARGNFGLAFHVTLYESSNRPSRPPEQNCSPPVKVLPQLQPTSLHSHL